VIVPDPLPAPEAQAAMEAETEPEAGPEPQPARAETPEPVAPSATRGGDDRATAVATGSEPPGRPRAAPARARGRRGAPRSRQAAVQRFQPLTADEAAAPPALALTLSGPSQPAGSVGITLEDATEAQAPSPVGRDRPSARPAPQMSHSRSRAPLRARPSLRDKTTEPWPLPAPVASTPIDTDDLLEELSERLARAAGELVVTES
jgi:hypothetical protein